MASNDLVASAFGGRIISNIQDHHTFEDVKGEHTVMYPTSEMDVATAVKLCRLSFRNIILHSGENSATTDEVDGTSAVVINMTGLSDIRVEGSRVTVGPAVTMESLAETLLEKGLFLPFRDITIKSVVAGVLSGESGVLTRSAGLISSYLNEIRVVQPDGTAAVARKDDDLFKSLLAKENDGIITSLVFDAVPKEEAKKFWMAWCYLPYSETVFQELTKGAFENYSRIPSKADLCVKVTTTVLGVPMVRVSVAGQEGSCDRVSVMKQVEDIVSETISEANLGDLGFEDPFVKYVGTDILQAIVDGGDLGGFSHKGQASAKHHRTIDLNSFTAHIFPYCEVMYYVHGVDENGAYIFPTLSMTSQMCLTRDNNVSLTAYVFYPDEQVSEVDQEPGRITIDDYMRVLNIILPRVDAPPTRRSLPLPSAPGPGLPDENLAISEALDISSMFRHDPQKIALQGPVSHIPDFKGETFRKSDKLYMEKAKQYATSSYPSQDMSPYMVTYPTNVADIKTAVAYGRDKGFKIVARSGGHQYCGLSSGGLNTIVLSMDHFKEMKADGNRATLGVGCRLTDIATFNKHHHITIPHGECPKVAIGGHCQTGGYGHLIRSFGLALDYVHSFKIVLANGDFKTVLRPVVDNPDSRNDDIFRGVLGGGPNSFGILTEITFDCIQDGNHPFSRGHQSWSYFQKGIFENLMKEVQSWSKSIYDSSEDLPDDIDLMVTALSTDIAARVPFPKVMWNGIILLEMVYGNKNGRSESHDDISKASEMIDRIYNSANDKGFRWVNKRRVMIGGAKVTPLSHMSDAFVRRKGTTEDGREFKYPYEKRLNGTKQALSDGFVRRFVDLVEEVIHSYNVRLVFQMGLGGGAYKKQTDRRVSLHSRRDMVFQVVFDLFYREGHKEVALSYQKKMKGILEQEFAERDDIRLIWGSYGDTDINKVWGNYYDNKELYKQLQNIKQDVDAKDVFHTQFTVQLPPQDGN